MRPIYVRPDFTICSTFYVFCGGTTFHWNGSIRSALSMLGRAIMPSRHRTMVDHCSKVRWHNDQSESGSYRTCGIDTKNMEGQGYDGAAAISRHANGVQKHICERYSSTVCVHCASHSLNLCLLKVGQVPEIRKTVTLMHEIPVFYCD